MNHRKEMRRRLNGVSRENSAGGSAVTSLPSLTLKIDRLVLEGIAPADRYRVADGVQSELTRLLGERGLPSGIEKLSGLERLSGGTISLDQGARAAAIGSQIADAVYQGFGSSESKGSRSESAEPASIGPVTKR